MAGIVASLVFVGLEIRQNTIAARAAAYQSIGFYIAVQQAIATDAEWRLGTRFTLVIVGAAQQNRRPLG